MSASPWLATHTDPRRGVRVGRVRVRARGDEAEPSAPIWQQRIEDALRCAHFGTGQRLVLLRKLQVNAGSASAPGWSGVVEAAAQDAVARACNGRGVGAEQAGAVWFESWDDAVAAWLDAALRWPAQRVSPHAWFWPRIARMAGIAVRAPSPSTSAADPGRARAANASMVEPMIEQAQAMWTRWQADPASQRACAEWLAQRPAFRAWLQPSVLAETAASTQVSIARHQHADMQDPVRSDALRAQADAVQAVASSLALADAAAPAVRARLDGSDEPAMHRAGFDANAVPPTSTALAAPARQDGLAPVSAQARAQELVRAHDPSHAAGQSVEPGAAHAAAVQADELAPINLDVAGAAEASAASLKSGPSEASASRAPFAAAIEPSFSALGWTHLRRTQLGGLPLTINALQRQGFDAALKAVAIKLDRPGQLIAASAPWLAAWSRLSPPSRQRWTRDPMFAVLPVFDALADVPAHERADALLASWRAQPQAVRQLGRQMWRRLQHVAQMHGWRSPRAWLQREAWMQLDATHLDVLFTLDQADLSVRRLGLDADPGWVPWLGRIVSLHFESANELPRWSTP